MCILRLSGEGPVQFNSTRTLADSKPEDRPYNGWLDDRRQMYLCELPRPHRAKLEALHRNRKLPEADRPRVDRALERYAAWVNFMDSLDADGPSLMRSLVDSLNDYKRFIEIDLIYDSPSDFLYRQKGQHKVDNSVLEEFLPRLADTRLVPGLLQLTSCTVGPQGAFAAFVFAGSVHTPLAQGGIFIKQKDQDYALSKQVYLRVSTDPNLSGNDTFNATLNVAYFAAECKMDCTHFSGQWSKSTPARLT
jgi:hypothetical protein